MAERPTGQDLPLLIAQEEPWTEAVILHVLRSGSHRSAYAAVSRDFELRLVLEAIRAINRFNRSSTVLAVAVGFVGVLQLIVMLRQL